MNDLCLFDLLSLDSNKNNYVNIYFQMKWYILADLNISQIEQIINRYNLCFHFKNHNDIRKIIQFTI